MVGSDEGSETVAHHETILRNVRDGIYTLDPNGRITWVNETAVEEFDIGYDRDELIGSPVSLVLNEADIEKCVRIIQRCLQSDERESGRCEVRIQTASGAELPCDLHLALLRAENGEFQGTVGILRDITDRKRREQRLDVLNRVLRHNLRNDMNVILGTTELLESAVDAAHRDPLHTIRQRGQRLIELADKVRWLSEIEAVGVGDRATVDVVEPVETLVAEFREAYPGVEFHVDRPSDGNARASVVGVESLEIAVRYVIENSIEHNDTSLPRVSVTIQPGTDRLRLRVEDNGPGLPETERAVLERGWETPLQHSSGVGLWLVYWAVTASGGKISFREASPRGTIVTLEFLPGERERTTTP